MRYSRQVNSPRNWMFPGAVCALFFFLLCVFATGCARTAPLKADLRDVLDDPDAHKGERIELTGHVIDYEPAGGDTYRTLNFTLGLGLDDKILVYGAGYTAEAIAKASQLLGEAFEAGGPVTVSGKLRIDPDAETDAAAELRLESVEYGGRKINVTRGRKTRPGFEVGGWHFTPSIGIGMTFTP